MKYYVRRALALASVAACAAIAASPAAASPQLNGSRAKNMASSYARNHWDPYQVLPSYSQATRWNRVSITGCVRWNGARVDCVITTTASNYYYDSIAEMDTGYAYCVGTVTVRMNRWGRVNIWAQGFEPAVDCDSTIDY